MRLWIGLIAVVACGATPQRHAPQAPAVSPIVEQRDRVMAFEPPYGGPTWRDAPPAPLDVVAWLDERDCIIGFRCRRDDAELLVAPVPDLALARTHRLAGPPTLDAEIDALDVDVRGCYRAQARARSPLPRMKLTVDARELPVRIVEVDPPDAPSALVRCIADGLRDVRTRAPAPVIVVVGPPS